MNGKPKRWAASLLQRSVPELVRAACILALVGLLVMIFPLVFPSAPAIVLSMGLGHVVGITAASLYLLAVILDVARRRGS
jgi:hypothetical protein